MCAFNNGFLHVDILYVKLMNHKYLIQSIWPNLVFKKFNTTSQFIFLEPIKDIGVLARFALSFIKLINFRIYDCKTKFEILFQVQ